MKRTVTLVIYIVAAVWMVYASIARVIGWLQAGTGLQDSRPVISCVIGSTMLVWLIVTQDRNPRDRDGGAS